jgi:hypothetical protein
VYVVEHGTVLWLLYQMIGCSYGRFQGHVHGRRSGFPHVGQCPQFGHTLGCGVIVVLWIVSVVVVCISRSYRYYRYNRYAIHLSLPS